MRTSTRPASQKNRGDAALGRSRGGLTTKIHAAALDENRSVVLQLTPGQASDCAQFDAIYDAIPADQVLGRPSSTKPMTPIVSANVWPSTGSNRSSPVVPTDAKPSFATAHVMPSETLSNTSSTS